MQGTRILRAASKLKDLPPDVARELLRHVKPRTAAAKTSKTGTAHGSGTRGGSSTKVVIGCLTLLGGMAAVPYVATARIRHMTDRDEALTPSQVQRGAFLNSGSKDAGRDPNWDWKNGKYVYSKGLQEHLKKQSKEDIDFGPDLVGPAVQQQQQRERMRRERGV